MTEVEIQSIALFFYFALLDDKKAIEVSSQAIALFREQIKRKPNVNRSVILVSCTKAAWDRVRTRVMRGRPNTSAESGWLTPVGADLGAWRDFQKNATEDELLTVIWSKILKLNDKEISEGLGITEGTIRYRLGRSLRKLGTMVSSGHKPASKVLYGPAGK